MGTVADKLTYLSDTKVAIHDAIEAKGVDIAVGTSFREYATKIADITTGDLPKPTTAGLVAYYQLTGTADDFWNNYNGTEYGGLTYVNDSTRGAVAYFGANQYIQRSLPLGTTSTISFWIKRVSGGIFIATNTYNYFNCNSTSYWTNAQGNGTYGEQNFGTDEPMCTDGNWHHIVLIDTGSETRGFKDGVEKTNIVGTYRTFSGFDIDQIGDGNASTYQDFQGSLSSLRIYDRALTQEEVIDIYNYESTNHPIEVDNGLIAYYPLKENAKDNWANQYDGTEYNGVVYDGESAYFNGTNNYISTPIFLPSGDITLSVWFKTTSINVGKTIISSFSSSGANASGRIIISISSNNTLYVNMGNDSSYWYDLTSLNIINYLDGNWHNITVMCSSSTQKAYIDGVLRHTYSMSISNTVASSYSLKIGRAGDYSGLYFLGNISNARVYNRAITDDEVKTIYESEALQFKI